MDDRFQQRAKFPALYHGSAITKIRGMGCSGNEYGIMKIKTCRGQTMAIAQPETLFAEVIDFLASAPTPEAIIAFKPSERLEQRLNVIE